MSQHLCTSLDVSPSGAGPSAWAGAAAFPLVFWRSQGAFNQSHVASYSIRCQSNTEVQRDLYQIPSYIDILNILRPVDISWPFQKPTSFPEAPRSVLGSSVPRFQDISDSTVLRAAVEKVGLNGAETLQRSEELRGTIQQRYEDLTHLTAFGTGGETVKKDDFMIFMVGKNCRCEPRFFWKIFGSSAWCQVEGIQ